jgi:hypothetical protein
MTNMLRDGANWLAQQMGEHASDPIVYSRASVSLTMRATLGQTQFVTRYESRDFIVDFACMGRLGEPLDGDLIQLGDQQFEVLSISGEQPYRFVDRHRVQIRIHTKEI